MNATAVIVGIGLVAFLAAYMLFKLRSSSEESFSGPGGNKHFLLQLVFLFLFLSSLTFLANAVYKVDSQVCAINEYNEIVHAHNTSMHYDYECFNTNSTQGESFYKAVLWIVRIIYVYIFLYFVWEALKFLGWVVPKQ